MKQKQIIWLIALLLCINLVFAIGVRPAKTIIQSESSTIHEGKIWIVNTDEREFTARVSLEGEMSEYITLDKETIDFREDDNSKSISFKIDLEKNDPKNKKNKKIIKLPPGNSYAKIVITEEIPPLSTGVGSRVIIKHKIVVEGPYPDKYIKARLNIREQQDKILFVSEVENLGKKDINEVKTTFYVNDKKQQEHKVETDSTNLQKKENKLLYGNLEKDLFEKGEFVVSALTTYDGQHVEMVKEMVIGEPEIDITYFDKYFLANKINQYSLDLMNNWNKKIKHVFVDITFKKNNETLDEFRTKSIDIEGETTERIRDFFDAQGKEPGEYSFSMVVNYWNKYKMAQREFNAELLEEKEYNLAGQANAVPTHQSGSSSFSLGWVVALAMVVLFGLYVGYRYKNRGDYI